MNFLKNFEKYDFPMFGYVRLPEITITDEERAAAGAAPNCSNAEFLHCLALKGYKEKKHLFDKTKLDEYPKRARRELDLFEKLGFVDYVLLVWKITSWCDKNGIARGMGRGSCCAALLFYLMGVTSVEPLKYELFLERFVSEVRAKKKEVDGITYIDGGLAPDVDLDIEQAKRGLVIEYLQSLYPNKVSKISTFSTLSGKILMKECGKIIDEQSEDSMKIVADMIPKIFGRVSELSSAYAEVPAFKDWCDAHPRAYNTALNLQGLIRNKGSHPSGYIVAFDELNKFMPLELANGEDGNKEWAASFDMGVVAYLTIKLDLLGVRCCSVISDTLKSTGVKVEDLNLDSDSVIYDNLQNLETPHGIFQLEAPTNLKVCRQVKPKNLSELSDILALARPGSLNFLDEYTKNKKDPSNYVKRHPVLDEILNKTKNVILYQETLLGITHKVFGISLEDAEIIRRAASKKRPEEMKKWEGVIYSQAEKLGLDKSLAEFFYSSLLKSADYSFNCCVFEDELVNTPNGDIKIKDIKTNDIVMSKDISLNKLVKTKVLNTYTNEKECFLITLENGKTITVSAEHKLVCEDGEKRTFAEALAEDVAIVTAHL